MPVLEVPRDSYSMLRHPQCGGDGSGISGDAGASSGCAAAGVSSSAGDGKKKKKHPKGNKRLAKQREAPMGKRGRWAGINSTREGRKTRGPVILSGGSE